MKIGPLKFFFTDYYYYFYVLYALLWFLSSLMTVLTTFCLTHVSHLSLILFSSPSFLSIFLLSNFLCFSRLFRLIHRIGSRGTYKFYRLRVYSRNFTNLFFCLLITCWSYFFFLNFFRLESSILLKMF